MVMKRSFRPIDPRWSSMPVLGKYSAFKQHHKDKLQSADNSQNSSSLHSCRRCDLSAAQLTLKTRKRVLQCLVHASSSSLQTRIKPSIHQVSRRVKVAYEITTKLPVCLVHLVPTVVQKILRILLPVSYLILPSCLQQALQSQVKQVQASWS